MKKIRLRLLGAIFLVFGMGTMSLAQAETAIPAVPENYVNDQANLLTAATRQSLEERLAQFERDTSNQILVATFPDLQGESIEGFSMRLAEKWKPGQSTRNNGAILVVSKNDHKVRIEAGYGLEGVLTDAVAKAILVQEILPSFKRGDFDAGISKGVAAIFQATKGEYRAIPERQIPKWVLPLCLILLLVLVQFFFNRMAGHGIGRSGPYRGGGWGGGGSWGGGGGWGGGSSSSGGGFSSGGGSFGGGGASGSW